MFVIRVSKFNSSKPEKVKRKMHENMRAWRANSDLLKSTLATCPFFFRIASKQEIGISAPKQEKKLKN